MSKSKSKSPWFKVRIKSSWDDYTWYADKIGDVIIVKKTEWNGWGYEHKSGLSVFSGDVEKVAK